MKSVHKDAAGKVQRWSFREQFLDTDRLRHINYGNLVLRREAHLFLTHGVVVSVLLLAIFWVVSANWNRLMGFGLFGEDEDVPVQCYEIVTNVTQLPPPPPIAPPEPPPPAKKVVAPPKAPPKVGKIKKVAEAPPEQTFATQKEIKQAIQQEGADQDGGGAGSGDGVVEFVNCQTPPTVVSIPGLRYPEMARIAGIEGRVFVRVLIGKDGRAIKAEVVKRIPSDGTMFDKEAIRIAMKTKYTPGVQNGRSVKVWMTIPVRFTLRGR